jgi:hypothetical protein
MLGVTFVVVTFAMTHPHPAATSTHHPEKQEADSNPPQKTQR